MHVPKTSKMSGIESTPPWQHRRARRMTGAVRHDFETWRALEAAGACVVYPPMEIFMLDDWMESRDRLSTAAFQLSVALRTTWRRHSHQEQAGASLARHARNTWRIRSEQVICSESTRAQASIPHCS